MGTVKDITEKVVSNGTVTILKIAWLREYKLSDVEDVFSVLFWTDTGARVGDVVYVEGRIAIVDGEQYIQGKMIRSTGLLLPLPRVKQVKVVPVKVVAPEIDLKALFGKVFEVTRELSYPDLKEQTQRISGCGITKSARFISQAFKEGLLQKRGMVRSRDLRYFLVGRSKFTPLAVIQPEIKPSWSLPNEWAPLPAEHPTLPF